MAQGLSQYFHIYVGLGHFWGSKFEFLYFWVLSEKNEKNGYEETVGIFRGHYKIGLFWGSFLYILELLLKVKVQNGNIFGGLQNLKCFGGMPDIPDICLG